MKFAYAAAALLCSLPFTATAQERCFPRGKVVNFLATKEGQSQRTVLLTHSETKVEVWGNDDSGVWTIIVSTKEGVSCFWASGSAFTDVEIPPAGVEG